MKSRASRAVPFYIFLLSSFFRAKWHKFCFLCAPLKSRRREKCFDLGTNRHRESLWREPFRRSPSRHVQRVFLAFSVSPFLRFCDIECEARRMTNLIIIASFYIFDNIIVGFEWSDPLDYVATLYIIHTNTNIKECAKNWSVEYKLSRHLYQKDSQLRLY